MKNTSIQDKNKELNDTTIFNRLKQVEKVMTGYRQLCELLTPQDVCKILKISRTTFETYKNDGIFPCYNLKGRVYVKASELLSIIDGNKIKPKHGNVVDKSSLST